MLGGLAPDGGLYVPESFPTFDLERFREGGDFPELAATFLRRRDRIVPGLNAIEGFECQTPGGAFYVYTNVSSSGTCSACGRIGPAPVPTT